MNSIYLAGIKSGARHKALAGVHLEAVDGIVATAVLAQFLADLLGGGEGGDVLCHGHAVAVDRVHLQYKEQKFQ